MKLLEKISLGTPFDIGVMAIFFLIVFIWYFEFTGRFIVGSCITLLGLVIWTWSRINIRKSFSVLPRAKKLVTNGIYSKIRHPVYVGAILTIFGLAILTNLILIWVFLFLVTIMQIIRSRKEEQVLIKKFGKKYLDYRNKTWF